MLMVVLLRGRVIDGDGRVEPHTLAVELDVAGSKERRLGLPDVAPAGPRWAKASSAVTAWDGVWGGLRKLFLASWRLD